MKRTRILGAITVTCGLLASPLVHAGGNSEKNCNGLPAQATLQQELSLATAYMRNNPNPNPDAFGFGLNMWATVVNRDGVVCAVAFTGTHRGDQWPGSRVISAQKAYTGNSFSLADVAISTAFLYPLVQPGGSLYGLSDSNPVDPQAAYKGPSRRFGQPNDPMVGKRVGGINTFGGGLPLYAGGQVVGGIGVSGDTSCRDHDVVTRLRSELGYSAVVANQFDGITIGPGNHPACP